MHVLHACGISMWLRLPWPALTRPVRCAAEVCFGNGQYDHCGVDRRRRNYWVWASWLTICKWFSASCHNALRRMHLHMMVL